MAAILAVRKMGALLIGEAFYFYYHHTSEKSEFFYQTFSERTAIFSQTRSLLLLVGCSMTGFHVSWALLARLHFDPARKN